jgi:hypothetical protein
MMTLIRILRGGSPFFRWSAAALVAGLAAWMGLLARANAEGKSGTYHGQVVDAQTQQPIEGAWVTGGTTAVAADQTGSFEIHTAESRLRLRAVGYERKDIDVAKLDTSAQMTLAPFLPKALYLSFYGIGSRALREDALRLIGQTELNALVIDVKGDHGKIPYKSAISLADEIGAQRPRTVQNITELLQSLHDQGIYTIARIVVFKDNLLAQARPDLAVKTKDGALWRDHEHLAWGDPFRQEVWDYNIDIAVEAAASGFDEIQFDYVRFPDAPGLTYAKSNTERARTEAIGGFLAAARKRLTAYNVFLAADVFGYVCWNLDDTKIGQKLEQLAPVLDILSPMLYPSSFQFGIPGFGDPVAHPYEIVYLSLDRARQRTKLSPARFRPWLQAFKDYGFDRRLFREQEIRAQIDAAEKSGTNGWMLWNPHNVYSADGLREK